MFAWLLFQKAIFRSVNIWEHASNRFPPSRRIRSVRMPLSPSGRVPSIRWSGLLSMPQTTDKQSMLLIEWILRCNRFWMLDKFKPDSIPDEERWEVYGLVNAPEKVSDNDWYPGGTNGPPYKWVVGEVENIEVLQLWLIHSWWQIVADKPLMTQTWSSFSKKVFEESSKVKYKE